MTANHETVSLRLMKRVLGLLLAGAVFVAMTPKAAMAQSLNDVRLLTPREEQRLGKEGKVAYDLAVKALDHVDPVTAIRQFEAASRLSPNALEVHFLTARVAHIRGRRIYGNEAAQYYDIALAALERVRVQLEKAGKLDDPLFLATRRYNTQYKLISRERASLEVRSQRRLDTGLQFRRIYAMWRYNLDEEGQPKEPEPQTRPQPRPGAGPAPGMRPPGPRPAPRPRPSGGGGGADSES